MGRRREPDRRLERFTLVLLVREREALQRAARAARKSMSELVRERVFDGPHGIDVEGGPPPKT
jgi:hypothetical protein